MIYDSENTVEGPEAGDIEDWMLCSGTVTVDKQDVDANHDVEVVLRLGNSSESPLEVSLEAAELSQNVAHHIITAPGCAK